MDRNAASRPSAASSRGSDDDLIFREGQALRVEDVMRILHLSKNTVYKLARTGELPSYRVGRLLRFNYDDVLSRLVGNSPVASAFAGGADGEAVASGGAAGSFAGDRREGSASVARTPSAGEAGAGASVARSEETRVLAEPSDVLEELPSWAKGSIVLGGQDMFADVLANYLSGLGIRLVRMNANPYVSLARMYQGTCHSALINLWSESEKTYNRPYVRSFLPGVPVIVFRLYKHRVGFTVAARNPKNIDDWVDLLRDDVSIVNRPRGDSSRVLLDEKIKYLEATTDQVKGYGRSVESELAQGLVVARGLVDVAVTSERPWRQIKGLDFLPMQDEIVDVAVLRTPASAPLIKALRALLRTQAFRQEFDPTLCDVGLMGEVVYEN